MTTSGFKSFLSNVCSYGLKWELFWPIINLDYSSTGRQPQIFSCKCAETKIKSNTSTIREEKSFLLIAALRKPDELRQKTYDSSQCKIQKLIRMSLVLTYPMKHYLNKQQKSMLLTLKQLTFRRCTYWRISQ